jgi:hypothetical protein
MFEKAQEMAVDKLGAPQSILAEVDVNLPIISMSQLKEVAELWAMFWEMGLIDKYTVQNKIPGIDIEEVEKRLEEEKEKAIEDSMINNQTTNNTLAEGQEDDDNE